MRVRMKVDVSGDRNGQPWPRRGGEIDLPDGEATSLCAAGLAVPVTDTNSDVEKAVPSDDVTEARTKPAARRRKASKGTVTDDAASEPVESGDGDA